MDINAFIARRLAAPKAFKVLITYANGKVGEHLTETIGQAKTRKAVMSGKIGRDLIGDDGETVRIVSIEIERI